MSGVPRYIDDLPVPVEILDPGGEQARGKDVTPGHDQLHHYWTKGEGLAKWAKSPHPWTALYHHLAKYVGPERAKRMAAQWHHEVFGIWPGEKKGKNPLGPGQAVLVDSFARHRLLQMLGLPELRKFDPTQKRDPRTGKWIDMPGVGGLVEEFEPEEVSGDEYYKNIAEARGGTRGAFLSLYTPEEYSEMRCFLAHGGKTGGALKDHGDGRIEAVSLFNNGGGRGAGLKMLDHLIAQGANYLEAFGDKLRSLYESRGFEVQERYPFDDSLAPPDWNYDRDGRPDYYTLRRKS